MRFERSRKSVALLVETSLGSGREILRGISEYNKPRDGWRVYHEARGLLEGVPVWLEGWRGDGIIARVQDGATAEALRRSGVPVVDVLGVVGDAGLPLVHVDDAAIAANVAEHFRSRGFQHFAFFGIEGENWSERRREGFRQRCRGGRSFSVFETPRGDASRAEDSRGRLRGWLRGLPKPVGVMVCSDQRGLALLEACRDEGIPVPERIAVAGVDNDASLCELATPPLSSVRGGHRRVGFEAARLLDHLMSGGAPPASTLLVPPNGMVGRRSSEARAIGDEQIAQALHFIHEHLGDPVTNELIARAAGLSRSLFQRRFREATGQTVREYLVGQRIRRARALIETTGMKLAEVAERSGFRHQEYMGAVFKQQLGCTPGSLR